MVPGAVIGTGLYSEPNKICPPMAYKWEEQDKKQNKISGKSCEKSCRRGIDSGLSSVV